MKTGQPAARTDTKSEKVKMSEKRKLFSRKISSSKNCTGIWKVIQRILNTNMNKFWADLSAMNEFVNKTAERFVGEN